MNSGKSFEILKVAHNYEEQGKRVVVLTSGVDTRSGVGNVVSRVGNGREAIPIFEDTDIFNLINTMGGNIYCVLIDESQFLKKHHIQQLANIVDLLGIPVLAYGLKNDFQNRFFEGSENLLLYADKLVEIKTICWFCEKKATFNLRVSDMEEPVYDGEQVQVGGNESYIPVCRKHYHYPLLESVLEFDEEDDLDDLQDLQEESYCQYQPTREQAKKHESKNKRTGYCDEAFDTWS